MGGPINGVNPSSFPEPTPEVKESKKTAPKESKIESAAASILNNPREIKDVELTEEDSLAALNKAFEEFDNNVQTVEESEGHTKLRETVRDLSILDYLESIPHQEESFYTEQVLREFFGEKTAADDILEEQNPLRNYEEELPSEGKKTAEKSPDEQIPLREFPVQTSKEKGKGIEDEERSYEELEREKPQEEVPQDSKESLEEFFKEENPPEKNLDEQAPVSNYPVRTTEEKNKGIDDEERPHRESSPSTNEKVASVGANRLGVGEIKSSGESNPVENRNRSRGLKFFRFLLRYLPNKLARPFSRVVVREGRVQISDIDARVVPKLSPRIIKALSNEQLASLKTEQFDQMSKEQLFAIGPRLIYISPEKLAYIISNRLSSDEKNAFLAFIVKRWEYDNTKIDSELTHSRIDDQHIGELFSWLTGDDLNSFLISDKEQFEKLVPFIPQQGFAVLKPELLGKLTPELLDSLDQEQLFGIGPRKLAEIGPKNMAHLISRLDEESGDNFLKDISERFLTGKVSETEFQNLFKEVNEERISKFLLSLKANNPSLFQQIYPKVFSETSVSFPLEELVNSPTFRLSNQETTVINADGEIEKIAPLSIFRRDAVSTPYIFNDIEIDPVTRENAKSLTFPEFKREVAKNKDPSLSRADFVLRNLYEVTGKDAKLTLKLQTLINQGTSAKPWEAVLNKYSVDMSVNPSFIHNLYSLNIYPNIDNPESKEIRIHIRSILEINAPGTTKPDSLLPDQEAYPLGYAQVDTEVIVSADDLLNGNEKNGTMTTTLSRVFQNREELNEHNQAIARLAQPNIIHPERLSDYKGAGERQDKLKLYRERLSGLKLLYEKAATIDLDKLYREARQIYKANPENMKARQDKAKEIAKAIEAYRAADAQAIDVATLKFRNAPAIISITNKVGVRIKKGKSLEKIRKEFESDREIGDFLNMLEKNNVIALLDDAIKELRDEPEMFNIAKEVKALVQQGNSLAEIREKFVQNDTALEFLRELEQRQIDYPVKSLEELFKEAQDQLLKMFSVANPKFPFASQPYGFTPAKGDYIWENDTELVHDLVLKEVEPFQGKVLSESQKQKIRARVEGKIQELTDESAASVRELRDDFYVANAALIDKFKAKVKNEILNAFKNGEPVIPNNVQLKFREKYFPSVMSEEVEIGNVLELAFQEIARNTVKMAANVIVEEKQKVSKYPEKLKEESKAGNADALVSRWVDDLVEKSKEAFYEVKVNYPDEAQAYAKLLLDEVLNNPYRIS